VVAVIIGLIALMVTVVLMVDRSVNRAITLPIARNSMVMAVPSRPSAASGETIEIIFTNGGAQAVMVGLSLRREFRPIWFGAQQCVTVPSSSDRRRYRPTAQQAIGIVPANGTARLPVRVPLGLRRRIVAVVGEADGFLRVITIRIRRTSAVETYLSTYAVIDDTFPWLP
jgi:hypothetical protein